MVEYRVLPAGDTALVIEFGDRIDRELSTIVLSLAQALDAQRIAGIVETVPTFRSLMIHYEPLALPAAALVARIDEEMRRLSARQVAGRLWRLPACYDAQFGIDLEDVAGRCALTAAQVVERHSAAVYHVYMLGFLPGQAYMGEVTAELALDRLETPRSRIPAGSVAIAAAMCCVFPQETPCGWRIIGRCPVPLWDAAHARALLMPGDRVVFTPVSTREYETLAAAAAQGRLVLEPEGQHDTMGAAA
jgi:inhibitor of KinA